MNRIYFVPGMFGFGQLAGYDYFEHLRRELEDCYRRKGLPVSFADVPSPPTSSLRERARVLASTIAHTGATTDQIHLLGHSTGGLDARLLLSASADLRLPRELLGFRSRVATVITLNTPHFGTPLAGYFATVSGARMLYALSLLTVVSLKLGEPSLAIFSRLMAGIGSIDGAFGSDLKLFSRATDTILRFVDKDRRGEIRDYLDKVQTDQGAILQISPESMDLFNTAVSNAEHVRYGSVAAAAPPPATWKAVGTIRSPYMALTAALYSTLYQFTASPHERYPYAHLSPSEHHLLQAAISRSPTDEENDGIVPTSSMIWGELICAVEADHLDTLGHFRDDQEPARHTDWLTSGARMSRYKFRYLAERIFEFQTRNLRGAEVVAKSALDPS